MDEKEEEIEAAAAAVAAGGTVLVEVPKDHTQIVVCVMIVESAGVASSLFPPF